MAKFSFKRESSTGDILHPSLDDAKGLMSNDFQDESTTWEDDAADERAEKVFHLLVVILSL